MKLRTVQSEEELKYCLELSLNNYRLYSPVPVDREYSWTNLKSLYLEQSYIRILEENGKIAGWITGSISKQYAHSRVKLLNLGYLHITLKGKKAVKAIIMMHEDAIEYAKSQKCYGVISSSILPTYKTYYRILENNGWQQYGCFMHFKTNINV